MNWLYDALSSGQHSEFLLIALNPSKRIAIPAIMTAVLMAYYVYALRVRSARGQQASFLSFLLPRAVYRHRSAWVDLQIAAVLEVLKPVNIVLMGLTVALAAANMADGLVHLLGPAPNLMVSNWPMTLLLGLVAFLLTDFATYLTHRLSHEVRPLWAFHRVHHSAEVLTPITLARKHPVYGVLSRVLDFIIVAPFYAVVLYLWPTSTDATVILVVRWVYGLFALFGGNLRHSHIWISFGPWERLLVSPAQHQIHHSRDRAHWDVNYGEVLAIWDWMFGTLHVAGPRRQHLDFGLTDEPEQPHPNFWRAMGEPFTYAWAAMRDFARSRQALHAGDAPRNRENQQDG